MDHVAEWRFGSGIGLTNEPVRDTERIGLMQLLRLIQRFLRSEEATTAVEYAVLLALILVALIVGLTSAGGGVGTWWTDIKNDLNAYGT